jgi:hypothetical protein
VAGRGRVRTHLAKHHPNCYATRKGTQSQAGSTACLVSTGSRSGEGHGGWVCMEGE